MPPDAEPPLAVKAALVVVTVALVVLNVWRGLPEAGSADG